MTFSKVIRKKLFYQFLSGLVLASVVISVYLVSPKEHETFDHKLRDLFFLFRGEIPTSEQVVIVDIDERSLQTLGQWPWQRKKLAKIIKNLTHAGAGIIGFDVVFSEYDNSSPHKVLAELGMENHAVPNFDELFGNAIKNSPVIGGYVFAMEDDSIQNTGNVPTVPAIMIEKNKPKKKSFLLSPHRAILNVPPIQKRVYSSGFFNTIPDRDGLVRSVPLIMQFENTLYPSLALEMIRVAMGKNTLLVHYNEVGAQGVTLGKLTIPTDHLGRMYVNYRGGSKTFPYLSMIDIYNNQFNSKDVSGKFILIGTSAAGLQDIRAIPFSNVYPGVEVHANVIDNIMKQDFIAYPAVAVAYEVVYILILMITLSILLAVSTAIVSLIILILSVGGVLVFNYYQLFFEGVIINTLFPLMAVFMTYIVSVGLNYFLETRQKEMIKGKFATKVSPAVMEELTKDPDQTLFVAMEKEVTVFFSDIRNFTNISEAIRNPKHLIDFMNLYMNPMTDLIIQTGGTIDKFIGDAIMAYWNAPLDVSNHADQALISALNQLHYLKTLNAKMRQDTRFLPVVHMADSMGIPIADIGIGLNTGVAIVGEMGSSLRADYTCIGDSINLGARLESLCKYYNSRCNISHATKKQLTGEYIFRFLDLVTVKGKSEPVEIWQVHDFKKGFQGDYLFEMNLDQIQEELDVYHRAICFYQESNFSEALTLFSNVNAWKEKSNQNIYCIYIERCKHYLQYPPCDFNGVFQHQTKG
jgi:adenylate cyclase